MSCRLRAAPLSFMSSAALFCDSDGPARVVWLAAIDAALNEQCREDK
jgi:hypothetical protein